MNLDYYFPTPVWWVDTGINNETILQYCYTAREKDPTGRSISNLGGWQSNDINPKDLPELYNYIMVNANQCLHDYGYDSSTTLEMGNMWVNINEKNHSNKTHIHHGSFISGVYYVKCNENSPQIVFYKNFSEDFIVTSASRVDRYTPISGSVCKYPPKEGRLILFPSYLPHSVEENETEEERISISFNIAIKYNV